MRRIFRGVGVLLLPCLLGAFLRPVDAAYNTTTCTLGCSEADTQFLRCDWDPSAYGGMTQCMCDYGGSLSIPLAWLDGCVVRDEDGLGKQNLTTYQEWSYICGQYQASGLAVAQSIAVSMSTDVLLAQWSTSLWPQIQSAEGSTQPVTRTNPAITTSSLDPNSMSQTGASTTSNSETTSATGSVTTSMASKTAPSTPTASSQSSEASAPQHTISRGIFAAVGLLMWSLQYF